MKKRIFHGIKNIIVSIVVRKVNMDFIKNANLKIK